MSDFHQHHLFTTLHRLARLPLKDLEASLVQSASRRRLALLLPSLATEMDGPALPAIVEQLKKVRYVHRIVVALDRATEQDYRRALEFFAELPQELSVIWLDGERAQQIFSRFENLGLMNREPGKGQAVWFALGHLLAIGDCRCVALHDCDIVTYDRYLLGRLCFPVLNPYIDFNYAKAYYSRISDRLNGRVCRLFVFPLLTILRNFFPNDQFLEYMSVFRYPLAGEMSMDLDVARHIRIPSDWGLEVGLLAEVYRNLSLKQICQVDIAGRYDHKHQELSEAKPDTGLMRMVRDIAATLLGILAGRGWPVTEGVVKSLKSAYIRIAQDYAERYAFDAAINGFPFDRHQEELTIEVFGRALQKAGFSYLENQALAPLMPNWNRMVAAMPELMEQLEALPYQDRQDMLE